MYTAIVFLSLVIATAMASAAIGDHAEIVAARNFAAVRAEQVAEDYRLSCAGAACDPTKISSYSNTAIEACIEPVSGGQAVIVDASIPVSPRIFLGSDTAAAQVVVGLLSSADTAGVVPCT